MGYANLLDFYEKNDSILIHGGLRPAKSITRNIISGVMPFISLYRQKKITDFTESYIARNILNLNCDSSSTSRDNIRNLQELGFLTKIDSNNEYHFTTNFIDFCNSGLTLSEHIYQQLLKISKLEDFTMFYNYIICTLIEGIKYGRIVRYPEEKTEFINSVNDSKKCIELCEIIYSIYGFKSVSNSSFGTYTPNINYRIISTCESLGIIKKDVSNEYGFDTFIITKKGFFLLDILDKNLQL